MVDPIGVPDRTPGGGLGREALALLPLALWPMFTRLMAGVVVVLDALLLLNVAPHWLGTGALAGLLAGSLALLGVALVQSGQGQLALAWQTQGVERLRVGALWRHGLVLALLAGMLSALLLALLGIALGLLDRPGGPLADAGLMLVPLGLGGLPLLLAAASASALEAMQRRRVVLLAAMLAVALHLLLLQHGAASLLPPHGVAQPAMQGVWLAFVWALLLWLLVPPLVLQLWLLPQAEQLGLRRLQAWRQDWLQGRDVRARGLVTVLELAPWLLQWLGLGLLAGGLGEAALGQLALIGAWLMPLLGLAWGLADGAGKRLAALLPQVQRRVGALGRSSQRGALWVLLLVGLGLLLMLPLGRELLPGWLPQAGEDWRSPLLLASALLVQESLALYWIARLRQHPDRPSLLVLHTGCALSTLLLAALLSQGSAWGLQWGTVGLMLAALLTGVWRVARLWRLELSCCAVLDDAAAEAQRQRAWSVANGYADTVLLWPGQNEATAAAPRELARMRRAQLR